MTDWQQEFAESIGRMTESRPADEERILGVKVGDMKIRQLKSLLKHGEKRLSELRSIASEAERLLADGRTPDQIALYELTKSEILFEQRVLAGLEYALESKRRGVRL